MQHEHREQDMPTTF